MSVGVIVLIFAVVGVLLIAASGTLWGRQAVGYTTDEKKLGRSRVWRMVFFGAWTMALPAYFLWEWHGPNPPSPEAYKVFPPFLYSRNVVTNFWGAVAIVLGMLGWNKAE